MTLLSAQVFAADYVLTSKDVAVGKVRFTGFNTKDFTSNIEIPAGGITSADNVTVNGYYDIKSGTNIDVNKFTYVSNGIWGNSLSFYDGQKPTVIKAKEIIFKVQWNNQASYNPNNTDIRDILAFNVNGCPVTFKGSTTVSGIHLGANYVSGTHSMTFDAYDENTATISNVANINMNYAWNGDPKVGADTFCVLTVKEGATLNTTNIYGSSNGDVANFTNTTTINIEGGTLNTSKIQLNLNGDKFTINHSAGTLGASANLTLGLNGRTATYNYNMGENAIFNTNRKTITFENGVNILNFGTAKGGFTATGGGELTFNCSVSALTGHIKVTGETIAHFGAGWATGAESFTVDAGSVLGVTGDIALNAGTSITLGVADAFTYGKLTSTGDVTGLSFGNLIFNISAEAFAGSDVLTLALNDLISATSVDWTKFNISSNYGYDLDIANNTISFTVPEPATIAALFGALALGLAVWRRRKF